MTTRIRYAVLLGVTTLGAALAGGGAAVSQDLDPPVTVETDFLELFGGGDEFLRGALVASGVADDFEIAEGTVSLTSEAALARVNRMRAFSEIEFDSLSPPFVLLTLMAEGETFECASIEPRSLVPEISGTDFGVAAFLAEDADLEAVARCRVDPEAKAEFARLGRTELRERYFNASGDLRSEFSDLARDPTLAAALIEAGFFVVMGDLSGRLKIR